MKQAIQSDEGLNRQPSGDLEGDVVFVGAGPQTLRALIALENQIEVNPADQPLDIVTIDPAAPGSGKVWGGGQPEYLLMNVSAAILEYRSASVQLTFEQWYLAHFGQPSNQFPPRAHAALYMEWAYAQLLDSPYLKLRHVTGTVANIARPIANVRKEKAQWDVSIYGVSTAATHIGETLHARASHVVLCTGHEWERASVAGANAPDMPDEGPEQRVDVLGAALTGFDAVMGLTLGRGGKFEPCGFDESRPDESVVSEPTLRYVSGQREPQEIMLVSRSGLLMLPKPHTKFSPELVKVLEPRDTLEDTELFSTAWWDELVAAAQRGAVRSGFKITRELIEAVLNGEGGLNVRNNDEAAAFWQSSLRLAYADYFLPFLARELQSSREARPLEAAFWLGRAWAAGYHRYVGSMARVPREKTTFPEFRARQKRLERWAHGPSALMVERLMALQRAEILRVGAGLESTSRTGKTTEVSNGRKVIVAHIPGPGILRRPRPWGSEPVHTDEARQSLWRQLLSDGLVTVREGEEGIMTFEDGQCADAQLQRTPGLFALGRPTEGPVIDHDSLSLTLHPETNRFARRIVRERYLDDSTL